MSYRVLRNRLNGRLTASADVVDGKQKRVMHLCSYDGAKLQEGSNHWTCTEYYRYYGRYINFSNGNSGNDNKYSSNVVRPVAAFGDGVPVSFLLSVWAAYHDCLRGKMTSPQATEYMTLAEKDIPCLAFELWSGTYCPSTSTCFLVRYPKWREVFAACFRDRIVHHWICLRLEPLFENRFCSQGNLSFNCRKNYGTEKAVEHLSAVMQQVSDNYHRPAWVFRGDLVGFFMSIDKQLLWYLLKRFILRCRKRYERERWAGIDHDILLRLRLTEMPNMYWEILLNVTEKVVMNHPEQDCVFNSPISLWKNIDKNKSLFTNQTGEPIGNLTTQLFANFLMSFFIDYVRFLYRGKNWGMAQFVDDFAIVSDDKRFLINSISSIKEFLEKKLKLVLHKNKRYLQPVSHGVLFVGTYIKPGRKYLSNRTVARMYEKCKKFNKLLESVECSPQNLQNMEQVLNSYLGFFRRKRTYRMRTKLINGIGRIFWKYFYVRGRYESVRLKKQYRMFL